MMNLGVRSENDTRNSITLNIWAKQWKILSVRCVCRHCCVGCCPKVTSALLGLLIGIGGMIAGWVHMWLSTVFLKERVITQFFLGGGGQNILLKVRLQFCCCTYFHRNSGCRQMWILWDICSLHSCIGSHKLQENGKWDYSQTKISIS